MKILISDSFSPKGVEILKKYDELTVDINTSLSPEELVEAIKEYDALIIRSNTTVTEAVIQAGGNLKAIGRAGIGLDNVDIPAATRKGIVVMNTPGGNNVTTAEHAVSLLMALSRKTPQANTSMKQGKWEKSKFMGVEVFQKTVGIVGLGRIGAEVCERLQGFGMEVLVYDPFISKEVAKKMGVERVEVADLFKRSDYITVHTPLLPDTRYLINAETIATMKDGVFLLNCARGGIIEEAALIDALKSGKVAGAALDVFEQEPAAADNPLRTMDQVICTPHLGASTREAQDKVAVAIAEQIAAYLLRGEICNAVNLPAIPAETSEFVIAYAELAELLGIFAGQLVSGGIEEISLTYAGEVLEHKRSFIGVSALKGVLTPILKHSVNYVNASLAAQERQITINETQKAESRGLASSITIGVTTEQGEVSVTGSLFADKYPRITAINNTPIEVELSGNLLVVENDDQPGVVGQLGSALASESINIAGMQLSLLGEGKKAISVIKVDSPVSAATLETLVKLPSIRRIQAVSL